MMHQSEFDAANIALSRAADKRKSLINIHKNWYTATLRSVHTSKFKRIRCASNANWSRSHCALSDAHQLNAHSMRIESIHFKMWIQCASNRIAWAIPEVMNNELIHALERWLLGRRHDLTIFRSSRSCMAIGSVSGP